ncbi:VTC domain-containing protein [Planomonospora alba]|uniref:VTC domain-containing protein n=1 Tax=Planomonospora alba TaxID=161354 RepID=A0ABP6NZZ5_9ACTN
MIPADGLDRFRPITLDELTARASLLTRLDRKYLLPAAGLTAFLHGLPGDVRVLRIDRRHAFSYRSVYFDTPELDCYLAAARRRRRRFKLRIRGYLDSGEHFTEVKIRGLRGTTVKRRTPYTGDGSHLGAEARAYAGAVLAEAAIPADGLRFVPVLTTRYRRTTLFVPSTGSRVTVDTELSWALPDGTVLHLPERAIVETKSGRSASEADRLLRSLGHRPAPVSKYATGLAALRPGLPAHRWLPVLRRHFPVPAPGTHPHR